MKNKHNSLLWNFNSRCPLTASFFLELLHYSLAAIIRFYQSFFKVQTHSSSDWGFDFRTLQALLHQSLHSLQNDAASSVIQCGMVCLKRFYFAFIRTENLSHDLGKSLNSGAALLSPVTLISAEESSEWPEVSWWPVCHFLWKHPGQIYTCQNSNKQVFFFVFVL